MNKNQTIAYLRQLCCSGLNKEVVVAEFLRTVQMAIPSGNNSFSGCNEQIIPSYHILDFVTTDLEESKLVAAYLTPKRRQCFVDWFKQHSVLADVAVFDESFYKSDMYNVVSRQYDQHHILWALIKHYGKTLGMLSLYRPRLQKAFSGNDQALLAGLLPYVAHALNAPDNIDVEYGVNGTAGIILLDQQGVIVHLSDEAQRLLILACHPAITIYAGKNRLALLTKMTALCQRLTAVFQGHHVSPPTWCHIAANGRFVFRAQWLAPVNSGQQRLIGMTIEHQEPILLHLLRHIKALPLSPTQREVCLMLAQNVSQEDIAQRLHIKLSTAKDHIRKIYLKLDIHRREELLSLLSPSVIAH